MISEAQTITTITVDMCNDFISHIKNTKQLTKGTLEKYRRDLLFFIEFLPETEDGSGRILDPNVMKIWQKTMLERGYNTSTISSGTSAINALLRYIGRWDLLLDILSVSKDEKDTPVLTRDEYLRLLKAAKGKKKERTYLLIKIFGSTPISVQNLPFVTVETVTNGIIKIPGKKEDSIIPLPDILINEMLAYCSSQKITAGPVFRTANGTPIHRSNLSYEIKAMAPIANVEPEKSNPRCIKKMYNLFKKTIHEKYAAMEETEFNRLLAEEQEEILGDTSSQASSQGISACD